MRVSDAINSRRSMRVFKPDPVPREDVEWIISTATRAASNGNLQPWKLYVTAGEARRRLSAAILKAMDDGDSGPGAEYNVYPKEFTPVYDARRETAVVAATGWLCGRFTWHEVRHLPTITTRRLGAIAEQARRRPVAS